MSKYKIFRIDHPDPVWIGKRRKRLNVMFSIMSFVFLFIYLLLHQVFKISFALLYPVTMLLIAGFYYIFYRRLKSENQKIKTIGDIEFTRTGIVKHIGDSLTEYKYDLINSIELVRHIPAINAAEGKSGFFSYILTLDFKDSHKENMVVSDRPLGKFQDLSIVDTLTAVKKLKSAEVILR
jgi:hypothetical protein